MSSLRRLISSYISALVAVVWQAGFPPGVFNLVNGTGPVAGNYSTN